MKTVLVTGATGFVGSHALEALMRRTDVSAIAACRDASRLPEAFKGEVRVGDLRDPGYIEALLDGVDVVCHCMAWTALWGQAERSARLYLQPTLALLDRVVDRRIGRFINISTTSAAAPTHCADPMSTGIARGFWPHLSNVVAIEQALRDGASETTTRVNLRLGIFTGRRYALGLLPILVPRLKTHLVPWVAGGRTHLPLIDGRDIGEAVALAATAEGLIGYEGFNIVGPSAPNVRALIDFLHTEFGLPRPHFSVPFPVAYAFAALMEAMDRIVPWEPLVTRSIVHLLEEVNADNRRAEQKLGYRPRVSWQDSVRAQMQEMAQRAEPPMRMHRPYDAGGA